MTRPAGFVRAGSLSGLKKGELAVAEIDGQKVLVCSVDGSICAVAETCPHAGAPLSDGYVNDGKIECPWHASVFDLKTGTYVEGPASEDLAVFEVAVEGDEVYVGPEKHG